MSAEATDSSVSVFEAMIDERTANYMRWLRTSCKLPNHTELVRCAVEVFDVCHESFSSARRIVLVSPHNPRRCQDVWPLEQWPTSDEPPLIPLRVSVNGATAATILKIKQAYELDSNDAVVPLIVANYVTLAHGIVHGLAVQTCTFADDERLELIMQYAPTPHAPGCPS